MVAVLLMALIVAGATALVSYNMYARSMEEHYERLTMNTARSAASMVDVQAVAELKDRTLEIYRGFCPDENTPPDFEAFDEADWDAYYAAYDEILQSDAYRKTFATLNALKEDNGVLWLYVAYMDEQTGQGIYIVDADSTQDACLPGTCGDIEPENRVLMEQGVYDFPPYITNYEEFGWLSSAAAAITAPDGTVVANAFVDFSMNQVMADRQAFLLRLAAVLAAVTLVLIVTLAYGFGRAVVRPINQLAKATGSFVSDKERNQSSSAISLLEIRTGDEIENLSCFDPADGAGDQHLYRQPDPGHGRAGAHRRRAGRGPKHPGFHAALHLSALSAARGVQHLCLHGPGQGGRRRFL